MAAAAAGEDLDQQRLGTPAPPGVKGTAAATALTPSTSSTFFTEPPTWNASSRNQKAVKRSSQPANWTARTSRTKRSRSLRIVSPSRTRAQNAFTRSESMAIAISAATASGSGRTA